MTRPHGPPPDRATVSVELTVPFHQVDSQEVVWHGHYVKYLELARMELERRKRLDPPELRKLGLKLMVAQTHLKHVAPLRFNDRVRVTTWLTEFKHRLEFEFEIFNVTADRRAATGRSILVVVQDNGELCFGTPTELLRRLTLPLVADPG